jgi:hypothetical protein
MAHLHPPLPTERRYVVYCDESRHDACAANPFMGIGGLWVPYAEKAGVRDHFDAVANAAGVRGELKWSKVTRVSLPGYKLVVDAFAELPEVRFRAILVNHREADYALYHGGDAELGFYSFYYHMLVKWLLPETSYVIVLDHKVNAGSGRYAALERRLRKDTDRTTHVRQVTVADSRESRLAQVADLLTGAVTAARCGTPPGTPKADLQDHIARQVGLPHLAWTSSSPAFSKFNLFNIQLAPAGAR